MEGERIGGRYQVLREIASGGMGVVCEAVHEDTGRHVALKIILEGALDADERREWRARFSREARAAGSIATPHIVQVFDAEMDEATGRPFIAMELLHGEDLATLTDRLGPLPEEGVLKIASQACRGLAQAHAAGVIHRDVKPGNLFLADSGGRITVKLVDFGIAKLAKGPQQDGKPLTQTGHLLGTPTYMSPEQAKGMTALDGRADVWSLGVVMYKALCGQVPHRTDFGVGELIVSICTKPAPRLRDRAPWVSKETAALVHRALSIDPSERFASADALRTAIDDVLVGSDDIDADELRALHDDEREPGPPSSRISRPTLPDTPSAISGELAQPAEPAPSGNLRWLIALPLLGLATYALMGDETPRIAQSFEPVEVAVPADATSLRVPLSVTPADARVHVDGRERPHDGTLMLEGALGQSFEVRVDKAGDAQTVRVAIASDGAVPSAIALPGVSAAPPVPPAQPRKDPAQPRASAVPKPGVGLVDEFE